MSADLGRFLADLAAYSLQLGLVLSAGLLLPRACRLRAPAVRLAWVQTLLVAALLVPFLAIAPPADPAGLRVWVTLGTPPQVSPGQPHWTAVVALVLGAGVAMRLAVLVRRLRRLRAYRRASSPLPASSALAEARSLAGGSAEVYVCELLEIPATYGALRPVVLQPAHFGALDEAAQTAVLCHEMRHARRHDWLQTLLEEVLCAILWFHPAVWWAVRDIRAAREQVVDQDVVRLTGRRRVYLETLVRMAGRGSRAQPSPAALFLTESHLKRRVDSLLKEVTMTKAALWVGVGASVAGVALAGVVSARAFPLAGGAPARQDAERKVVHKPQPAYPAEAKKKGIEGVVLLDVLITAAGDVKDVKVTKGPSELHDPAMSAVRQWKYEAGPHDTRATLVIHYKLAKKDEKPGP